MWYLDKRFQDVVIEGWNNQPHPEQLPLHTKLFKLANQLMRWNENSFGNTIKETKVLRNRIAGIQKNKNYHTSVYLQNLETTLLVEYYTKLKQEEMFWAQRPCVLWLNHSDKNTRFFHLTAKIHHKANTIYTLKN